MSINQLQSNIIKTVGILVTVMLVILLLFLNKITTPRYLSDIELKVNGLVLLKPAKLENINPQGKWLLVANNDQEMEALTDFYEDLKSSLREKIQIVLQENFTDLSGTKESIALIHPQGYYLAYVKSTYDNYKMTLTLASVITHRDEL